MPPLENVSKDEFYRLIDAPHNQSPEYTDAFEQEHERSHRHMKDGLAILGGGPEALLAMEDGWTCSRYVAASISSPHFIRPDLFFHLYRIVEGFEEDYAMHLISDLELIPPFEVYITKTRFVLTMDELSQLKRIHDPETPMKAAADDY